MNSRDGAAARAVVAESAPNDTLARARGPFDRGPRQFGAVVDDSTAIADAANLPMVSGLQDTRPVGTAWSRPKARRLALVQMAVKRGIDVVIALIGLIAGAPFFLVIASAIKLSSPGPVLFRQRRPGRRGRPFWLLKFRTMRSDAQEFLQRDKAMYQKFLANGCKLPEGEDPRIFAVGRWLRKTSLDELPQLVNVLRGEMSIVGPRPLVGPELENYGEWSDFLFSVKPGLTGYWQVNGRSRVSYPERAHLDIHYVLCWSLWLDLKIIFATIPQVLKGFGAY